mmetsp:Transcript_2645/g.3735  ORF Transcript_2645/g.3735 Transcript_2645/m.3735 type:complete len:711 (+) Transcript_2645:36-2168(+)
MDADSSNTAEDDGSSNEHSTAPRFDLSTASRDEIVAHFQEALKKEKERADAEKESADAAKEREDAAKERADAEKESADAAKERAHAEKERADREATQNHHNSYPYMIERFGGIPDMPKGINLKPHERQGTAAFVVNKNLVTDEDLNFNFNETDRATGYKLQSFLHEVQLVDVGDPARPILSYENEATVADYVQSVVRMCLKSMGYFQHGRVCKEMSLFSLRPDLILVMHKSKGLILIIEVKMPGEELFQSGGIAKQVGDYLLLQYRLGNTTPFVLLSSYREACLCHLDSGSLDENDGDGEDDDTGDDDEYRNFVEEAATRLKQGEDFGQQFRSEKPQDEKPANHSPSKASFSSLDNIPISLKSTDKEQRQKRQKRRKHNQIRDRPTVKPLSPRVVYSQPFKLNNMVHGVSLAIACGLISYKKARESNPTAKSYWPNQLSSIDGLHPQVAANGFNWAMVKNMCINYTRAPYYRLGSKAATIENNYLLLQESGRGKNGKVFLAVNYDGLACALKFYINAETEAGHSHRGRATKRSKDLDVSLKIAKEECRRWHMLQEWCRDFVAVGVLNSQAVLRMPVFAPVPPEKRRVVLNEGKVRTLLHQFFEEKYLCKEMRWQHFGCRRKDADGLDLCLLDMESLLDLAKLKTMKPEELAQQDLGSLSDFLACQHQRMDTSKWLQNPTDNVIAFQIDVLIKRIETDPPATAPSSLLNRS